MSSARRDPTVVYWKIYYGGGTEWSSNTGVWAAAPDSDVQMVVLWRADGMRRMMRGTHYYWHDSEAAPNAFGLTDNPVWCAGHVKTGKRLGDGDWLVTLLRAMTDMQFLNPPINP